MSSSVEPALASARRVLAWGLVAAWFAWPPVTLAAGAQGAGELARFGFGKVPTPAEIAAWDIDVRPDGTGLPTGRGTVAQGQVIYDAQCASCHGTFGESNDYMAIAGGVGSLGSDQPMRTTGSKLNHATTLWDYINRAMPFQNPKSLLPDEVYALTAYVLHLSDILPADAALDRQSIVRLKLPNWDGFTTSHGFMSMRGKPDTRNVACMRDCTKEERPVLEMPEHARDAHGDVALQMRSIGPTEGAPAKAKPDTTLAVVSGGGDLAKSAGCTVCHGATQRVVGPAFREIRDRYANDALAGQRLAARVRSGGSGAWGEVPMPPQPQVNETDAEAIVKWILGGAR